MDMEAGKKASSDPRRPEARDPGDGKRAHITCSRTLTDFAQFDSKELGGSKFSAQKMSEILLQRTRNWTLRVAVSVEAVKAEISKISSATKTRKPADASAPAPNPTVPTAGTSTVEDAAGPKQSGRSKKRAKPSACALPSEVVESFRQSNALVEFLEDIDTEAATDGPMFYDL